MGITIGKRAIDARLEKFKEWRAAKNSPDSRPAGTSGVYVGEYGKPGFKFVPTPTSHLIPQPTFDFPADHAECRHKVAWASDLKKLEAAFRRIKPAHEVIRLNHTGWYGDSENYESLHVGYVMQLPGKNRKERWLAMVVVDDCESIRVELDAIYDSAEDAAHAADESARIQAEHEDEYRRADEERLEKMAANAGSQIDDEAKWALAMLSEAFKFGEAEGIREKFAEMAGNTVEEVDRMLAAFAELEKNWANVSIELNKFEFA